MTRSQMIYEMVRDDNHWAAHPPSTIANPDYNHIPLYPALPLLRYMATSAGASDEPTFRGNGPFNLAECKMLLYPQQLLNDSLIMQKPDKTVEMVKSMTTGPK